MTGYAGSIASMAWTQMNLREAGLLADRLSFNRRWPRKDQPAHLPIGPRAKKRRRAHAPMPLTIVPLLAATVRRTGGETRHTGTGVGSRFDMTRLGCRVYRLVAPRQTTKRQVPKRRRRDEMSGALPERVFRIYVVNHGSYPAGAREQASARLAASCRQHAGADVKRTPIPGWKGADGKRMHLRPRLVHAPAPPARGRLL
jgi:hypothetical protein